MACGIGVCMTCVLPGDRRRRRRPGWCAPASMARCSAATGSAGTTSARSREAPYGAPVLEEQRMTRMRITTEQPGQPAVPDVDLSTTLGGGRAAQPDADRVGLRRGRSRARPVLRRRPSSARSSPSRSCCAPASGRADAADGRDARAGCSTRSACRVRASTPSSTHDLPWLRRPGCARRRVHRGQQRRRVRQARAAARVTPTAWPPSRSTSPAPTSRTAAWSSPATRALPRRSSRPYAVRRHPACRSSRSCRPT